ncbi:MAG: 2Fe-2S iron-sulfur cluster-binding protein [bacterium]
MASDTNTSVQQVSIKIANEDRELRAMPGANLRTLAINGGAKLYDVHIGPLPGEIFNCRGLGLCGTCLVEVVEGMEHLKPAKQNAKEVMAIGNSPMGNFRAGHWHLDQDKRQNYRLACQVQVMGDCTIRTVHDTLDFALDD